MKQACKKMRKKFACAVKYTKDGYLEIGGNIPYDVQDFLIENYEEVGFSFGLIVTLFRLMKK